nr:MAG: capsid protein [Virus sp.]
MRRTYRRKSYGRKRVYKRSGRPTRKISKKLRSVVKRVISRNMETKTRQLTSSTINVFQAITNTEVHNIIPAIFQGTTQQDRIGNRIKPVRMTLKLAIIANNMNAVSPGASSSYFDVYIFKSKFANQGGIAPTSGDMSLFLQNGSGGDSYNGQVLDGLRPVNADLFTLLTKRRVTLNNIANSSLLAMNGYYQSTAPQKTFSFNLSKHLKDTWIYNDANTNLANDNFYIAIGSTQTDGTFLSASVIGTYQFITDLRYKDA